MHCTVNHLCAYDIMHVQYVHCLTLLYPYIFLSSYDKVHRLWHLDRDKGKDSKDKNSESKSKGRNREKGNFFYIFLCQVILAFDTLIVFVIT